MSTETNVQPVFTFFNSEIEEFVLNNSIDIQAELQRQGVRVDVQQSSDPAYPDSKDAVTVLLASAAAAATLMPAIARILEALIHRPIIVKEMVPVAITDERGDPVFDSKGEPRLTWVERTQVIPQRADRAETKASVGFLGFKFEYASSPVK